MRSDLIDAKHKQMLDSALEGAIAIAMDDPDVTEILVNEDSTLWIDTHSVGLKQLATHISKSDAARIIRLADALTKQTEISHTPPVISACLPQGGARFTGILPPVSRAPLFSIRKRPNRVYDLQDYVSKGGLTALQREQLQAAVAARSNILVVGGTGSGKTTFANALLREIAGTEDRVVLIEDIPELQCSVDNSVSLLTQPDADMTYLVRWTLRMRPDRIIVGEVRGPEALDLLKSWNTGHPGGIATIHANSPAGGLRRLEQLIQEALPAAPCEQIADTIDIIVFIEGKGRQRKISSIRKVAHWSSSEGYLLQELET